MIMPLFLTLFGLLLLLMGMYTLRDGLEKFAGDHFKQTLGKITATPGKGFVSGMVATGFLQSSTALTVMTVSLVDARLIPFENALSLILGSNIGTTITPQLLAFPLDKISVWLIVPGIIGFRLLKIKLKYLMLAVTGLGMMFFSLTVLEASMTPFTKLAAIQDMLHHLDNNYLYSILAGTLLSALLHSSSASAGLLMVLTQEGWLNLPASLAFILGANIGTCFTAVLVSLFTSRAAQRVAIFHVLLNISGVLIFIPFIDLFASLISGLGGNLSRQVANAHTIFNLVSSLFAFPLLPYAGRFLTKLR